MAPSHTLPLRDPVPVRNAGLVLLSPFIPMLFERLQITVGSRMTDPTRGAALLHFLAVGEDPAPADEVIVPNVLCGTAHDVAPSEHPRLTGAERDEAVTLLNAVLAHWSVLNTTSIPALRDAFLTRPGVLTIGPADKPCLTVAPSDLDLLLHQIPWGFRVVRFPWLPHAVTVDW